MNYDQTENQSDDGQSTSKKLSMRATTPPSEVPGYRLTRFLGSGAFGQVWVGVDLNTGRNVAVKFYLHRGGVNWSLLSREVKNLVTLSADRHVVQVLEVGWDADPPYYVMELVGGGSLEDLLEVRPRLPVAEAVAMFRKICVGLNHCHSKGVLHCDIKPANILIGDDAEPRLADFGQSRLSHEQTPALGTLFYMAPEQADLNSTPDASWDVYAVGAILYRMLIGSPPYRSDEIVEQIDTAGSLPKRLERYRTAIASGKVPDRHLQHRGVDRPLARIISRCLAVDPKARYANIQQILDDVNRRDHSQSRRPLMLLGILGPLLILLATSFFGYRSIKRASTSTMKALRTEAFGSNQLAASFAARTLESEIGRYYQLAQEEASRRILVEQLQATLSETSVRDSLDQIAAMRIPIQTHGDGPARQALLKNGARKQLDQILAERLARYTGENAENRRLRLATMFITDSVGTILGIAYDEDVDEEENSAGRNFCYRTYFHGGRVDLSKSDVAIGEVLPLESTNLSAAFPSTATRFWKVAVSTPIFLTDDHSKPDAIFVATINLGDFELLQSKQGANQVAVLIEAREGTSRGTILQHPLMDARQTEGRKGEDKSYQMTAPLMDRLLGGGDVDYLDPLASADDGKAYGGPWIAAIQPVALPRQEREDEKERQGPAPNDRKTADLLVLVQYRLEKVMAPVDQMRSALLVEGAAALASILAVTFTLWFFVRRVGQAGDMVSDATPEKPTIPRGSSETMSVR
ncbi:Serine/threonine-protein kinase PknL [Rubripirellula tenax]|uniref:Serine/threonine-protein kinase PknL n=2 Tax=Rubripirellula tenax TaxID=2528015 RepID=A0A5C6EQM1_9BACT|nr:Serine/threonine-protein kinase PknL [Rubripirellula tenax]